MSFINDRTQAIMNARIIANFILRLDTFQKIEVTPKPVYNHMGALYTDVILQSGLNYENVVKPRVQRILERFPNASTLNLFCDILELHGTANVLQWNHEEKIKRMHRLLSFSKANFVNTIEDLIQFISINRNQDELLELNGVGPKTVDYLMRLLGFDTIAVDRHISKFVEMAGIYELDYSSTKLSVGFAADLLGVSKKTLDYSIWTFMSKELKKNSAKQLTLDYEYSV